VLVTLRQGPPSQAPFEARGSRNGDRHEGSEEHSTLTVQGSGKLFTVDGLANAVCGGIHADNATIYVIDEVLHP
jgi:uncharacterized surface protein with fasciclin (FAS1) repeats